MRTQDFAVILLRVAAVILMIMGISKWGEVLSLYVQSNRLGHVFIGLEHEFPLLFLAACVPGLIMVLLSLCLWLMAPRLARQIVCAQEEGSEQSWLSNLTSQQWMVMLLTVGMHIIGAVVLIQVVPEAANMLLSKSTREMLGMEQYVLLFLRALIGLILLLFAYGVSKGLVRREQHTSL